MVMNLTEKRPVFTLSAKQHEMGSGVRGGGRVLMADWNQITNMHGMDFPTEPFKKSNGFLLV